MNMQKKSNWLPGYYPTAATKRAFNHFRDWGMTNTARDLDRLVKEKFKQGHRHIHTDFVSRPDLDSPLLFFAGDPTAYIIDREEVVA